VDWTPGERKGIRLGKYIALIMTESEGEKDRKGVPLRKGVVLHQKGNDEDESGELRGRLSGDRILAFS